MFSLLSEISFVLSALGDYLRKVKPGTSLKKLPCFRQARFRLKPGSPEAFLKLGGKSQIHSVVVDQLKKKSFRASVKIDFG